MYIHFPCIQQITGNIFKNKIHLAISEEVSER